MNRRGIKKTFRFVIYSVLIGISIIGIFILMGLLGRENDKIVKASGTNEGYINVNPKFEINFINGENVNFKTVSSYKNPFEDSKENIFEKIIYKLGIKEKKSGIEISLMDVSYDNDLQSILAARDIKIATNERLNKGFELISIGSEIGSTDENKEKDTIISRNVYKGVDIKYQVIEGKGLKEEIVLNELPEYTGDCRNKECSIPVNRFLFKISLDEGLSLKKSLNNSSIHPSGTYYIIDRDGNYLAHFLPEFAIDALGYKTSKIVSNISRVDSGEYLYEVVLDSEWLLDQERVFPIKIDPSIIHDSEREFQEGTYDRTGFSQNLTVGINSSTQKSGVYTSSVVELNENSTLKNIIWEEYGRATKDGEIPFSELGLIFRDDFNDMLSDRVKWGSGSLYLKEDTNKLFNIDSDTSEYVSIEFWSYKRHLKNEQSIFTSELGDLIVKEDKYTFKDYDGNEYISDIPVVYNHWQYITLVFSVLNNKLSIYVDEYEYVIDTLVFHQKTLDSILFKGYGYIDTLRVYERLLARNEISSNSQYGDIYFQLVKSSDISSWGEWDTSRKYIPKPLTNDENTDIFLEEGDSLNNYDLISFDFLLEEERNVIFGDSKFGNGIKDDKVTYLNDLEGSLVNPETINYIDLQFVPVSVNNSCLLSVGGLEMYIKDNGKVEIKSVNFQIETEDMYEVGINNHIAISTNQQGSNLYLNGNIYSVVDTLSLLSTTYSIGSGCASMPSIFNGDIKNVRVMSDSITDEEVIKYASMGDRSYTLRPVFKASLQNDQQIVDINDTQFSISEMDFGAINHIVNLNIGDSIVIREGEYTAEGVVTSIHQDTGKVEVNNWLNGSNVPKSGFTKSAKVLKWQSEYIPIKDIITLNLQQHLNIAYVGINIRDISIFSDVKLENFSYISSSEGKYLKYRLIFTTSKYGLSPYISNITLDYEEGGPSMDQIMRHGKWFNESGKQPFWWTN